MTKRLVLHQLLLNEMALRARFKPVVDPARRYTVAVLHAASVTSFEMESHRQQWSLTRQPLLAIDRETDRTPVLSAAGSFRLSRQLSVRRGFLRTGHEITLNRILWTLRSDRTALRTKALKALSHVLNVEPSLIKTPQVYEAIGQRLSDTATSVREAAVSLVGDHIMKLNDSKMFSKGKKKRKKKKKKKIFGGKKSNIVLKQRVNVIILPICCLF